MILEMILKKISMQSIFQNTDSLCAVSRPAVSRRVAEKQTNLTTN